MSSSTTDRGLVDVTMPAMGTSMSEGTVLAWLKSVGDRVEVEETICEISTDKIDTECPSPATGELAEIVVDMGRTVDVGTVLARIAIDAGAAAVDRRYSPLVRRIAADREVDLGQVKGTGRGGRVGKKTLLSWLEDREQKKDGTAPAVPPLHSDSPYRPDPVPLGPAPSGGDDLGGVAEPLSPIRRSIGQAMLRSQEQAATCHTVVECDFATIERRRRELGLTALPLVTQAVVEALREYPDLNATLDGDTVTRYGERVHLGIAVSLGADGLIVPVIHDAQKLSAEGLATRIDDLAGRARAKQLQPRDVQGASFTITSPGAFGAVIATPVIDRPQVGILDFEAVVKRPVVVTDVDGADAIAIRPMANFVLGWDHRALDGVYAARFLTSLRRLVEQ